MIFGATKKVGQQIFAILSVGDSSWTTTFPLANTRHEGHHHLHDPLEPRSMRTAR